MTASEDGSPVVAAEASDASTLRITSEDGTGRQDPNPTNADCYAGENRPCCSAAPQQGLADGNAPDPVIVMLTIPYILP